MDVLQKTDEMSEDAESISSPCLTVRPQQVVRDPDGSYQLFRIGDAVAGRNIHAAIYDARSLCLELCAGHLTIDILDRC